MTPELREEAELGPGEYRTKFGQVESPELNTPWTLFSFLLLLLLLFTFLSRFTPLNSYFASSDFLIGLA